MSMKRRMAAKSATLDGARAIYAIMMGLSIREGLMQLFPKGVELPGTTTAHAAAAGAAHPALSLAAIVVVLAYLCTVMRYCHVIFLMIGLTQQRIGATGVPVSRRVALHFSVILLLGMFLALMALTLPAQNPENLGYYIGFTGLLVLAGQVHYLRSGGVRQPLRRGRLMRLWRDTVPGSSARTEVTWMALGAVILIACIVLHPELGIIGYPRPVVAVMFSAVLLTVTMLDYILNRTFYYGGSPLMQRRKMVVVSSPLWGESRTPDEMRVNINRAQFYCREILKAGRLQPFAPHAFYSYILHGDHIINRVLIQECTWAFIDACDYMYLYCRALPGRDPARRWWNIGFQWDEGSIDAAMREERARARATGVAIDCREIHDPNPEDAWRTPPWHPLEFGKPDQSAHGSSGVHTDRVRKRVCVALPYRWKAGECDAEERSRRGAAMRNDVREALWYCHQLLVDTDEFVAPFAPVPFYSYIDHDLQNGHFTDEAERRLLDYSISILPMCDAVYIYTGDGLLSLSDRTDGMMALIEKAELLGIEVSYRMSMPVPDDFTPALPGFGEAEVESDYRLPLLVPA